ncbi:MAG: hypothetical protein AB1941_30570 [Gemmatimonadota bacterium]
MQEDERDRKRAVNPAMRRDAPGEAPSLEREEQEPRPVKGTQGAELNPVDEAGITE